MRYYRWSCTCTHMQEHTCTQTQTQTQTHTHTHTVWVGATWFCLSQWRCSLLRCVQGSVRGIYQLLCVSTRPCVSCFLSERVMSRSPLTAHPLKWSGLLTTGNQSPTSMCSQSGAHFILIRIHPIIHTHVSSFLIPLVPPPTRRGTCTLHQGNNGGWDFLWRGWL